MVHQEMPQWQSRAHFFGVAARLMRQILVDYSRVRRASKRGGQQITISIDDAQIRSVCATSERILNIDAAITKLAALDERKSRVVEMRIFGGMKLADIALALLFQSQRSNATCAWPERGCGWKLVGRPGPGGQARTPAVKSKY